MAPATWRQVAEVIYSSAYVSATTSEARTRTLKSTPVLRGNTTRLAPGARADGTLIPSRRSHSAVTRQRLSDSGVRRELHGECLDDSTRAELIYQGKDIVHLAFLDPIKWSVAVEKRVTSKQPQARFIGIVEIRQLRHQPVEIKE
jgi:hypothetical protein